MKNSIAFSGEFHIEQFRDGRRIRKVKASNAVLDFFFQCAFAPFGTIGLQALLSFQQNFFVLGSSDIPNLMNDQYVSSIGVPVSGNAGAPTFGVEQVGSDWFSTVEFTTSNTILSGLPPAGITRKFYEIGMFSGTGTPAFEWSLQRIQFYSRAMLDQPLNVIAGDTFSLTYKMMMRRPRINSITPISSGGVDLNLKCWFGRIDKVETMRVDQLYALNQGFFDNPRCEVTNVASYPSFFPEFEDNTFILNANEVQGATGSASSSFSVDLENRTSSHEYTITSMPFDPGSLVKFCIGTSSSNEFSNSLFFELDPPLPWFGGRTFKVTLETTLDREVNPPLTGNTIDGNQIQLGINSISGEFY